jgi:HlyD family secretion protein
MAASAPRDQKLMNIVPERMPLRVQARISPDDADDLQIGQRVLIRLASLHERALPDLEGQLTRLSADSLVDERTGQRYFSVQLTVPNDQLRLIQSVRAGFRAARGHAGGSPHPAAQTHRAAISVRTLVSAFWTSFREH